jgi:hypothetical protein
VAELGLLAHRGDLCACRRAAHRLGGSICSSGSKCTLWPCSAQAAMHTFLHVSAHVILYCGGSPHLHSCGDADIDDEPIATLLGSISGGVDNLAVTQRRCQRRWMPKYHARAHAASQFRTDSY